MQCMSKDKKVVNLESASHFQCWIEDVMICVKTFDFFQTEHGKTGHYTSYGRLNHDKSYPFNLIKKSLLSQHDKCHVMWLKCDKISSLNAKMKS